MIVLIMCGTAVIIIPFAHYFVAGWRARRKDIMDGFDADACVAYFQMFARTEPVPAPGDAIRQFDRFHRRWYGRRFFVAPGCILLVVSTAGVAWIALAGLDMLGFIDLRPTSLPRLPITAMAGASGAYLWTANDLISRARRLDMAPSDVMWAVLRLVISIPMGYAFARIGSPSLAPFVAFALGAFPLAQLIGMMQKVMERTIKLQGGSAESADDIVKLQGINPVIAGRLAMEDINTITQIAYCDPVRLIMRSSLTFNFITDCMNQALAWMYFQDALNVLRPLGVRGAVELRCLIEELDDATAASPECQAAHGRAAAAFPLLAAAVKQSPATFQIVMRQIADDPYTIFLTRIWS
ncbi:MAG TPA: hypothetical protein VHZ53_02095 [Steroidobacteraceae bacterium]|nr:hypothetical protein [Steroidobacteraceae bacterium]